MTRRYIPRTIEPLILRAARQFPVVLVTGPRQTGKSTLLQHLFPQHRYVTLDDPIQRTIAKKDPKLFIENLGARAIVDEIQYAPHLLSYMKIVVDRDRQKRGRFLLTGSQVFPLTAKLAETLAGRIAVFELLGFSWAELGSHPRDHSPSGCFKRLHGGFFPDPAIQRVDPALFYGNYLTTYLERDIRQIRVVQDLSTFQAFLELLAARSGSLTELSEVARDAGISPTVARQWTSLLEATRIIYRLRPFHRNITKRVVKMPKLYFTDTGLLAYLLRYPNGETMRSGPMAGAFFETMVVMEELKRQLSKPVPAQLYFYRDSNGNEADLLIDDGQSMTAVEIKSTLTVRREHATGLLRLPSSIPISQRYLVSHAAEPFQIVSGVQAIPWWQFMQKRHR